MSQYNGQQSPAIVNGGVAGLYVFNCQCKAAGAVREITVNWVGERGDACWAECACERIPAPGVMASG